MIKTLIVFTLAVLASSQYQWAGQYTIYSASYTGTGYTFCDLPVVGSSSSIAVNGNTMTWTRASTTQGTVTEPLNWSPSQDSGSACLTSGWCVQGTLAPSSGYVSIAWYLQPDQTDTCIVALQPVTPPPPPPALTWVGHWNVIESATPDRDDCPVPKQGIQVVIVSEGAQMVMNGGGGSWTLPWLPTNLNPASSCTGKVCTAGSLYTQSGAPAATINWQVTTWTIVKCYINLSPSSSQSSKMSVSSK